jgi:hypothetical protein
MKPDPKRAAKIFCGYRPNAGIDRIQEEKYETRPETCSKNVPNSAALC